MKHVKIYEEFYSDDEIKGLLGTLSNVGQANRFRVECNVFIMTPMKKIDFHDWPEWAFRNIDTEVYCEDDRKIIFEKAFEKVLKGEFKVEGDVYLDKMFKSVPELVPVLSKEHIMELAMQANSSPKQHSEGKLHTLQAKLLTPEIEDLMYSRMAKIESPENPLVQNQAAIRHLDENIGYNVKIHKL